jgi:ATP-dependent Zn protease
MQGLDPTAPVFVIAATNHPSRVDPALRRAGRLDRVVNIPYPTSEALSAMYADYLEAQCGRTGLALGKIDLVLLGRMSLGLTGADVELIVRGAARRARRTGGGIRTEDLIAEITNKPRDSGARRLGSAELERVAIHESGHALARYLSSTAGEDLGFVSIVPRSDGSLGFVALAPDDRVLHTRQNYLELIDVALAGRAAEELRYGPDGVSGGCASDLVAATATALQMITRYGLGPNGRLLSVPEPAAEHLSEAEELLASSYRTVLDRFRAHQAALNRLAAHLLERQELVAEDVISSLSGR